MYREKMVLPPSHESLPTGQFLTLLRLLGLSRRSLCCGLCACGFSLLWGLRCRCRCRGCRFRRPCHGVTVAGFLCALPQGVLLTHFRHYRRSIWHRNFASGHHTMLCPVWVSSIPAKDVIPPTDSDLGETYKTCGTFHISVFSQGSGSRKDRWQTAGWHPGD
jgi:hypothetical protein